MIYLFSVVGLQSYIVNFHFVFIVVALTAIVGLAATCSK